MTLEEKTVAKNKSPRKYNYYHRYYQQKFITQKLQNLAIFGGPWNFIPSKFLKMIKMLYNFIYQLFILIEKSVEFLLSV